MKSPDTPKDGELNTDTDARAAAPPRQTIQDVLIDGAEPTEEFLEEWNALENAPELSDEEFERQALSAPGDDGDTETPE